MHGGACLVRRLSFPNSVSWMVDRRQVLIGLFVFDHWKKSAEIEAATLKSWHPSESSRVSLDSGVGRAEAQRAHQEGPADFTIFGPPGRQFFRSERKEEGGRRKEEEGRRTKHK